MENSPQVTNSVQEDPQLTKLKLEVENLRQLNAKLAYEVDDLRNEGPWAKHIRRLLPILTGLLAVAGFWFGIFQYIRAEDASRTARQAADSDRLMQQKNTDDRALLDLKRETAKPLWDKQLGLYIDAAEKAAIIATTTDDKIRTDAENRFWVLYWGPLAVVEDIGLTQKKAEVEEKMVQFAQLIQEKADQRDSHALKLACLNLAHAIRDSLAPAFNVEAAKLQNLRIQSQK